MLERINSCDGRYAGSLDIRFTKACDNACSFCIERPGVPDLGTDVDAMIQSALESPQDTLLILGGEPLLMLDRVLIFVESIRPYKKGIYLTTSLPRIMMERTDDILHLVGMLDGVNISLQHYDADRNNEILSARSRHNRLDLLRTLFKYEEFAAKARVSINLVRGGMDSAEDLNAFLDVMQLMGCRHVKINELQNSPDMFVSFEELTGRSMPSPFSHGCQTDEMLREGMRVTVKRSCFVVEPSLNASPRDLVKVAVRLVSDRFPSRGTQRNQHGVMYENGSLAEGWLVCEPSP